MDFGWLLCVNIGSSLIFKKCIFVVRDVANGGGNACMWEGVYGKSSHPYTYRGCIYWAYYSRKTGRRESGLLMTSLTTVLIFQTHEKLNILVTNNPSLTILLQADRIMWYISVPWPPHCKTSIKNIKTWLFLKWSTWIRKMSETWQWTGSWELRNCGFCHFNSGTNQLSEWWWTSHVFSFVCFFLNLWSEGFTIRGKALRSFSSLTFSDFVFVLVHRAAFPQEADYESEMSIEEVY